MVIALLRNHTVLILDALKAGEFHLFPDSMAKDFWGAYAGYAAAKVEAQTTEA